MTPTWVTLSSRSGFASSSSAARADTLPCAASSSSRERRTDTSATSAAAKKPFSATMASSNVKRRDILVRYNRSLLFNTPLLRAINLSIAVLLVALVGAAYWFAWRPLPQTSGEIAAPIAARATVARDALGVPHISAASWEDAIFLQGYVTAQDRMWQMDALRRLAAGELAEVVGPSALDQDQESRRLRLSRIAEAQAKTLTPETKAIFAAYARGVNYYLETHRGQLPLEFTLLNYQPRPWRIEDTLLAALQMFRMLTTSWPEEIRKLHMLEKGDTQKVEFLYPARTGTEVAPGSNAWAVSGAHTASGKPILAGDPHLDWSIPSPWYLVHLEGGDLDVTGASLPGIPAVILGHNRRIAWSVTNLEFDVQDLYREQIDAQTGRYQVNGQVRQAVLERDWIGVKGQKPLQADTWITAHGPDLLNDEGKNYSLRWTAAETATMEFPFLALDRAGNWEEFNQALRTLLRPGAEFRVRGRGREHRISCRGCAAESARAAAEMFPRTAPRTLANGPAPFPTTISRRCSIRASGIIASANQNPFPEDYRYAVNGGFAPPYRAREIRTLLSAREKWKPEEMLSVQKDVYSELSAAFWRGKPCRPGTSIRIRVPKCAPPSTRYGTGTDRWRRRPRLPWSHRCWIPSCARPPRRLPPRAPKASMRRGWLPW